MIEERFCCVVFVCLFACDVRVRICSSFARATRRLFLFFISSHLITLPSFFFFFFFFRSLSLSLSIFGYKRSTNETITLSTFTSLFSYHLPHHRQRSTLLRSLSSRFFSLPHTHTHTHIHTHSSVQIRNELQNSWALDIGHYSGFGLILLLFRSVFKCFCSCTVSAVTPCSANVCIRVKYR